MRVEIIEKLSGLITAAFGLVAALAWNEAIQGLFKEGGRLHFLASGGPWAYAAFASVLAVIAAVWIGRVSERVKNKIS